MKKSSLLFIIPALAMVACSSDETVNAPDGPGINFSTAVNGSSRATETTTDNIQNFSVTAMSDQLSNLIYFKDFRVDRQGNSWKGNGEYLWPDEELKFCAYSPADAPLNTAQNRTGLTMILRDFTVNEKAADQIDLLAAQNSMPNEWLKSSVGLFFDHTLSQIKFRAICSNPVMKIDVYGVMLGHINSKGNFTYPANDGNNLLYLNQKTATDVWSNLGTPKNLISTLDKPVTIQGAEYGTGLNPQKVTGTSIMSETDNSFMIIPQHLKDFGAWTKTDNIDGAYLGVKCKIYLRRSDGDYSTLYWPKSGDADYICIPLAINFDPAKTYNIILDLAGGGYSNPENPPVKPIIENYISYSVTVTDWTGETPEIIPMEK